MTTFYTHRVAYSPVQRRVVHELAKFEDSSEPVAVYELWEAKSHRWKCTCPAFGRECKHPGYVHKFEQHGDAGWAYEPTSENWIDLFPLPRGANGLLLDVRGEQLSD